MLGIVSSERSFLQILASGRTRAAKFLFKRIAGNLSDQAAALLESSLIAASNLLQWKEIKLMIVRKKIRRIIGLIGFTEVQLMLF